MKRLLAMTLMLLMLLSACSPSPQTTTEQNASQTQEKTETSVPTQSITQDETKSETSTKEQTMSNHPDAAVFIMLGQSNAVGHGVPMDSADVISKPLKNVFGLSRTLNQSFNISRLTWSGYVSAGMNLAEQQDNTYSVPNCLAASWQKAIDEGADLPDLYIIQIAIGAQGVMPKYMWYPDRADQKQLIPGKLGTCKISLTPFTNHIFSLLDQSFQKMNKSYEIMGIHWRGGENDFTQLDVDLEAMLKKIYLKMFASFRENLSAEAPIILHDIVCFDRPNAMDPSGEYLKNLHFIRDVFKQLDAEMDNTSIFDVTKCPLYQKDAPQFGIFKSDNVHYTPEVNRWVADTILADYQAKLNTPTT